MGNSTEIGWRQLRQKILWEQRSRAGEESEDVGHLGEKTGELSKGLGGGGGEPELPPEGTREPWQVLSWRGMGEFVP